MSLFRALAKKPVKPLSVRVYWHYRSGRELSFESFDNWTAVGEHIRDFFPQQKMLDGSPLDRIELRFDKGLPAMT